MMDRQHLILDADDTLWENNVYFEDAFDRFCEFLDHSALTPAEVRLALDQIEIANNRVHGYGARNFGRNLVQCFEKLAERAVEDDHRHHIASLANGIFDCPMELMPGVLETLPVLAARHELTLFTKGDPDEQNRKIDRSGLREFFDHCAVVKEKNVAAYVELGGFAQFRLRPHVDDREQSEVGHQSCTARGHACGVRPPRPHVGIGKRSH